MSAPGTVGVELRGFVMSHRNQGRKPAREKSRKPARALIAVSPDERDAIERMVADIERGKRDAAIRSPTEIRSYLELEGWRRLDVDAFLRPALVRVAERDILAIQGLSDSSGFTPAPPPLADNDP